MATLEHVPSHLRASQRSAEVRGKAAELKAELTAGTIGFTAALDDERAGCIGIAILVAALPQIGIQSARRNLTGLRIFPGKRVRDLSTAERSTLSVAFGDGTITRRPYPAQRAQPRPAQVIRKHVEWYTTTAGEQRAVVLVATAEGCDLLDRGHDERLIERFVPAGGLLEVAAVVEAYLSDMRAGR